jgi:hypothetical protein
MHTEFVATCEAIGQTIWIKKFVPGLRVFDSIEWPLRIYCDNEAAVFFSHNNKSSGSAKYIDIKCHIVKEKILDHTIEVEHIRTHHMLADPLTKGLPPSVFSKHAAGMGLKEYLWSWITGATDCNLVKSFRSEAGEHVVVNECSDT